MICALLLLLSQDADPTARLRALGATVTPTSVDAADCTKWTAEDFAELGKFPKLRTLSLGAGVTDAVVVQLSGLPELESLQTNLAAISDGGVKPLARLPRLKVLKFFHPGKTFTGSGLAHLTEAPGLERLTVAGSLEFGDAGMAAVAKLERLKEFRSWHCGQTIEGVKKLTALKNLKSLTLGQRLAYKPPTTLSDETLAVLAEMKSLDSLRLEEARLKVDALLLLKQLPDLKKLELEGIDLPEADVEHLRKELPKVDVKWTKPNDTYMKRIQALFGPN